MRKRETFIFDMDGTMFDTEPISYHCWQEVAAAYGYEIGHGIFTQMLGRDHLRIRKLCLDHFGGDFPYEKICSEKVARQLHYYQTHPIPVKRGLLDLLTYARDEKITCAVASSSPRELIVYLLKKTKLEGYFSVVQSGEEAKHGKPAPDVFLMACQKMGAEPENSLVLEDSATGVLAAHAAHIPVIWLPDLVRIPQEIQALALATCQDLAEVPAVLETIS